MDIAQLTLEIRKHLSAVEQLDVCDLGRNNYRVSLLTQGIVSLCFVQVMPFEICLTHQGVTQQFPRFEGRQVAEDLPPLATDIQYAAMNAKLVECPARLGAHFEMGDLLYTLSSMKMRMRYYASEKIEITAVHATVGEQLKQGQHLLDWKKIENE